MNRSLRVGFISQWFPPEPATIPFGIADALRTQGLTVATLTGIPNYPEGNTYAGFSANRFQVDTVNGIVAVRCPLFPYHGSNAILRSANYISFAASSTLFGQRLTREADVNLVYSSPATAALAAMQARRSGGTPYVLLVQDVWPDSVFATGFYQRGLTRRLVERTLAACVDRTYQHAQHVIVISDGMKRLLVERGVPKNKISVVFNWADERIYRPLPATGALRRTVHAEAEDVVLLYAGNHGYAQGLGSWIDAFAAIADESDNTPNVHLVFIGNGPAKGALIGRARACGAKRVHFLPAVASDDVPALLADADCQIVSLADDLAFDVALPSKLQSGMAAGRAIAASARGDVADVVHASGAGWVVPPDDVNAISSVIRDVRAAGRAQLDSRGRCGRQYYEDNMSAATGSNRIGTILRQAARDKRAANYS